MQCTNHPPLHHLNIHLTLTDPSLCALSITASADNMDITAQVQGLDALRQALAEARKDDRGHHQGQHFALLLTPLEN